MTVKATKFKAGRSYKVGQNGAGDVSLKYQVLLTEPLGENELPTSFAGVPAIGSVHPSRPGLYALSYDVSQPDGAAKHTLDVTVNYGPADITVSPGEEEGDPDVIDAVTEWGWDDGTGEKELVTSVAVGNEAAKPVLNSAGDPFDSVPTINVPTPTFTKVIRSSELKAYAQYFCTVNAGAVTIGGVTCPAGTLLCTVAMKKIIGEWRLPYEYTIHLRYRSNIVSNTYPPAASDEIGWDAAVTDAGMREIDDTTGELKLIQVISKETGQPATVSAPELLDGHGKRVARTSQGEATPVVLTFHAYHRANFPEWFYSEPPTPTPPADNNAIINGGV